MHSSSAKFLTTSTVKVNFLTEVGIYSRCYVRP